MRQFLVGQTFFYKEFGMYCKEVCIAYYIVDVCSTVMVYMYAWPGNPRPHVA